MLVVPAEGNALRVSSFWKSGFYHIAREAGVPIVLSYLDYARKRGGFGPAVVPPGSCHGRHGPIRDFYADKIGRHPRSVRPPEPRIREEDAPPAAPRV